MEGPLDAFGLVAELVDCKSKSAPPVKRWWGSI